MTKQDWEAAELLASEFSDLFEAAKFLRSQAGFSLREAAFAIDRIADQYPESPLAERMRQRGRPLAA